jgi:F-box/leucine-rich repeat protein 2/20
MAGRCRYIDDASRVSDAGITALAAVFTELEVFEVTHSNKVGDDGIATIAENCPKLRVLNLSYCNNIGNAALKVLGR